MAEGGKRRTPRPAGDRGWRGTARDPGQDRREFRESCLGLTTGPVPTTATAQRGETQHVQDARVQVARAGGPLEIVERDIPAPGPAMVRVRVEANGICHSDVLTKEGLMPGIQYPRVPGHEVAGVVDAVGERVEGWTKGDRVGIGWHGGHCGTCKECRRGNFRFCLDVAARHRDLLRRRLRGLRHRAGGGARPDPGGLSRSSKPRRSWTRA